MGHARIAIVNLSLSLTAIVLLGAGLPGCSTSAPIASTESGWVLTEARANTFTYNRQTRPTVAATGDGGMVVAWASRRQEDGAFGIYAQHLDAIGRPMGSEVHVNQHTRGAQDQPAIAISVQGDVWIVWSSSHTDGDARAIMARRYAMDETGIESADDEFMVNTTTMGDQAAPSIAIAEDGNALVTWIHAESGASSIIARSFSSEGAALTSEIKISHQEGATDRVASVASLPNGYAFVWSRQNATTESWEICAQRTDLLGNSIGAPIEIARAIGQMQIEPSIATDQSGVATIAWLQRESDEDSYVIFAQRFDQDLAPLADAFVVDPQEGIRRSGVAVAAASDGRFAIIWNEEGAKIDAAVSGKHPTRLADIKAQRYCADATPMDEAFIFNDSVENRQAMTIGAVAPRVVWTEQDQLIAVWHGATIDDKRGVGVSIANTPSVAAIATASPAPWAPTPETVTGVAPAPPVFDPEFVPQPRDATTRGVGSDFGFLGIPATGWSPPDPDMAVGPTHVIAVANGAIAWFTKDGAFEFQQAIEGPGGFWGAQGAQGFVFDPVALYDIHSDRFVVAAVERDNGGVSFITLAISNTSDPNDGWVKFRQNAESIGQGIDFPNLGVDEDAVYISVDFFGPTTGSQVFAYDKAALIAGTLAGEVTQMAAFPVVTAGVYMYDTGSPNYYTLTAYNSTSTQLRLQAIIDPLGGHNLSTFFLTVPSYSNPPDAPQAGTSNLASTIDFRIKHAVYRNGSLWCSHAVNGGGAARVRWYEIEMNGWPQSGQSPTLRQMGDINPGPGVHTWFPDIGVDDAGNAAIAYNRSSISEFIKIARTVRKAGDPLGEFRPSIINQQSASPENGDRWGDYSGVHEDPASPGVFWSHLEYRSSFWNTWITKFSAVNANPTDFSLLAPTNNTTLATTTPMFSWEPAIDADSYTIIIATNSSLTNVVYQQAGIAGTTHSPPLGALDCSSEYHWGVLAENLGGASVSTPVGWSFTASLLGDLTGDGVVDTADLGGLLGSFGSMQSFGDLNGDGVVDTSDLGLLLGAFGDVCE